MNLKLGEDFNDDEEAEEREEDPDEEEPEVGPPLLTSICQDAGQSSSDKPRLASKGCRLHCRQTLYCR